MNIVYSKYFIDFPVEKNREMISPQSIMQLIYKLWVQQSTYVQVKKWNNNNWQSYLFGFCALQPFATMRKYR